MKYGYIRVSTKGQAKDGNSLEGQEKQLKEAGAEKIFKDVFTGKKIERPQLKKLLKAVDDGDSIIVTKLDRMARTAYEGIKVVNDLLEKGVSVHILNIGIIDNSPTGKLIRTIFLGFAEFERDMIIERTQEGKAIAKLKPGFKEGRPRIDKARMDHAMELLETESYNSVASQTGISKSSLIREKKRRKNNINFIE